MTIRYVRSKDYDTVHMEGEWVILDADQFTVTKLNETGGFYWSLLAEPRSAEELLEKLGRHYTVPAGSAREELEEFLLHLVRCGLVEHEAA
ncbi:PqqD family protein [Paenibacillus sp. CC-CFT747]|nr:PqqD family protein [Paenibacillus sp. CC-CFT747]